MTKYEDVTDIIWILRNHDIPDDIVKEMRDRLTEVVDL